MVTKYLKSKRRSSAVVKDCPSENNMLIVNQSPFDVAGVQTDVTIQEIVNFVRVGRERSYLGI
jgi:hypothetical protein